MPVLLNASVAPDPKTGLPSVTVTLTAAAGKKMFNHTVNNVHKRLATVYVEQVPVTQLVDGKEVKSFRTEEHVISAPIVQSVFGKNFQTTGLSQQEADDLARQLKSGALAAPMQFIEERVIGPSLGAENVERGTRAVLYSFTFALAFFLVYYRMFGIFTCLALLLNLLMNALEAADLPGAFVYRTLDARQLLASLVTTARLSASIYIILGASNILSQVLAIGGLAGFMADVIALFSETPLLFLFVAVGVLLVAGLALEPGPAIVLLVPIFQPIVTHLGIDPLHFGVVFVVNMEIGYLMPPVATNLFVAAAVFKKPFGQVTRAIFPTLGITCVSNSGPHCSEVLATVTSFIERNVELGQMGEVETELIPW